MSLDPAIFRALVEQGATPAMLLAVVEAAATIDQEKRERKRAGNAERQKRFREARSADRNASNALQTVTERDAVTDGPSPASPNDNNLTPSTHTPGTQTPRVKAGHRMPADWQPQPLTGELAKAVANWPLGALDRELERFRDWALSATGTNAKKSDWQAAWRNWIRKADDEGRYRNGQRNGTNQRLGGYRGGSSSGYGSTVDAFADFVADLTPH